ncbi:MAG: BTAD domain-containing putative transcriptional regulator [Acidimicrobiales bacterium]
MATAVESDGAGGQHRDVRCAVLGPLEVTDSDGVVCTPNGALQRRLLAMLVLHRNSTVSTDALVEVLWPGRRPDGQVAAVHTHVFRLRRHCPGLNIDQQPPGYRLRSDGLVVDVDDFEAAISRGSALRRSDPGAALDVLSDGLALWRGQPFDDLLDDDDAAIESRRLDETRLRGIEERLGAMLDMGRAADTVAELEALVARMPLREHLRELLMGSLAATGRVADALRCYDDYRRVLGSELGVDPSSHLQARHHALLTGDTDEPQDGSPTGGGPTRSATPGRHPPQLVQPLIGREQTAATVDAALARSRVVTLLGTGGVGKTSVAVEAAHRLAPSFAGGVWFVELAGSSTGTVEADVFSAFAVEPRSGVSLARRLASVLPEVPTLLVVDNCEHVLDDVAPLVEDLAGHLPHLSILATSRERLAVAGEHLVPVAPLACDREGEGNEVPPALHLFSERARAIDATFRLDDDTMPVVSDICHHLGGLPLAIELAATRLHTLDLEEIRAGLRTSHVLLSGGRRALPRHRSITAALAWSFDLLDDDERQLMRALSMFASPFTPADAAAVLDVSIHDVTALLAGLVEKSLVQRLGERFTLLEPVRQFAESDDIDDTLRATFARRHAHRFAEVAEEIAVELRTASAASAMSRLRAALPDAREAFLAAVADEDLDVATRLCAGVRDAAFYALLPEPLTWAAQLVDLSRSVDHSELPGVLAVAGLSAWKGGDLERADRLLDEAIQTSLRRGADCDAYAMVTAGTVAAARGDLDGAERLYRTALDLPDVRQDPLIRAETWAALVAALSYRHDPAAAIEAEMLVGDWLPADCHAGAAWCWYGAGEAVLASDPSLAHARLTRAVDLARGSGVAFVEAVAGASLTSLEVRHGDPLRAVTAYRWLLPLMQRGEAVTPLWTVLRTVTELLVRGGVDRPAATLLGAVTSPAVRPFVFGDDAALLDELRSTLVARLGTEDVDDASRRGSELDDAAATSLATAALDLVRFSPARP